MKNRITKKVLLKFPDTFSGEPFLYTLIKEYDIIVNIFRAKIDPDDVGYAVMDLLGDSAQLEKALAYIVETGIIISEKTSGLNWDENACVSCGACLPHCPPEALHIPDRNTMKVSFNEDICIECLNCISHCPFKVCSSLFAS
jgi:L-aspartate semialdehyde sulfurtransferase ferredoxin